MGSKWTKGKWSSQAPHGAICDIQSTNRLQLAVDALSLKADSHCARQRTLTSVKDARQRTLTDTYNICKLYANDIQRHYLRHYLL